MRVYLDSCSLQRPLDDQTQPRIRVETEAVLAILAAVQVGDIVLVNSEALEYEMRRIPDDQRRNEVAAILALPMEYAEVTDEAEKLAESFENRGIHPMDAVHRILRLHQQQKWTSSRHAMIASCEKPKQNPGLTARSSPRLRSYRRFCNDNTGSTNF
jgi:hypothetical protein